MEIVTVYLGKEKMKLDVRLVERRPKSILVKLPDGNIIVRKNRDIVKE